MDPSFIVERAKELPIGLTEKSINFNLLGCSFDRSKLNDGE